MSKPKIAIFKFSSCSGCQQELLRLEEQLLDLVGVVDLAYFVEAKRENDPGPYDVGIVEGSISTPHEAEEIKQVREQCATLIAVGACATVGGIQSLKNWRSLAEIKRRVYEHPDQVDTLTWSTGIDTYVPVDIYLHGCPYNREELVETVTALLLGRAPILRPHSVCVECKLKGNVCLLVANNEICLGPVTRAGCGALCPSRGRGCYGCHGPMEDANIESFAQLLEKQGLSKDDIIRQFRQFTGYAELFRKGAELYD